jgi:hypothetical protein
VGLSVVDYDCPDGTAEWCLRELGPELGERLRVSQVTGQEGFHKTRALNIAAHAVPPDAEILVFLDADTVAGPGLFAWIARHMTPHRFLIAAPNADGLDEPDLTGVLAVSRDAFLCAGGYDEDYREYGAEDLDLRLRLHLGLGLEYGELPLAYLSAIRHDDGMRSRFHREKSLRRSNLRNLVRLSRKMRVLCGLPLHEQPLSALRLWGRFAPQADAPTRDLGAPS